MVSSVQPPSPSDEAPPADSAAPGILLLPSHLFFVRAFDLPPGLKPEEVASFVEVSVEQISPFSLPQLYYGYYLPAESTRVLIYAAYRKKLDLYVDEVWEKADLVIPEFVALLGLKREGATVVQLQTDLELTAAYWSQASGVPARVFSRLLSNGATTPEASREEVRRRMGAVSPDAKTIALEGPIKGSFRDRHLVFELRQSGGADGPAVEIPRAESWTLDVRDKEFLRSMRKARRQSRWVWSGVLVFLAAFMVLAIFEVALFAGRAVLRNRQEQVRATQSEVARIQEEQQLSFRLEELVENRLMPFELLAFINQVRPPSIHFTRIATTGPRTVEIQARTPSPQDVVRFERSLQQTEGVQEFQFRNQRDRDGQSTFFLDVTVTPRALQRLTAVPDARVAEEAQVEVPPGDQAAVNPDGGEEPTP